MPITTEDFHSSLYDLLRTKGYQPIPLDSKGKTSPFYPEADVFKFSFIKDGKKYGDVWATVDNGLKLVLYYDDEVSSSPSSDTKGVDVGDSWPALLKHLKRWAQRRQLGFELKNKDHLVSDMQQREFMRKKEQLGEGYYPMGKKASYNDTIPQVKIVIQHSKQLGEGEQRFRHVEKIFVENTEGERFAVPTKKPGLAKIYARHVAEGGTPYDDRGRHLTTLIEEYTKMVGFMRATKNGEFSEAVQPVVEAGRNHFTSLRETLSKLVGHRGYHNYFDSWTPVLNEEQEDSNIATLFTKQQLDPRIASCIPILSKIARVDEAKPVKELDDWADEVISETTGLPPASLPRNVSYRDKKKMLQHLQGELEGHRAEKGKEAALAHYKNQLKHDEGVAEGASERKASERAERAWNKGKRGEDFIKRFGQSEFDRLTKKSSERAERAWNGGVSDEDFIKQFGKSEFDRLTKKYGDGSIPVPDLHGYTPREPTDPKVRLHRGLDGPGAKLKAIIKKVNDQGVAEGTLSEFAIDPQFLPDEPEHIVRFRAFAIRRAESILSKHGDLTQDQLRKKLDNDGPLQALRQDTIIGEDDEYEECINYAIKITKPQVSEGEVVEFSLPKAIQNLALEWVEYTYLEDGPEQKRIENELSKKGFDIDFSYDGNALLLTHSKTGKEFLVQIPEKMQELAEGWDEDSYIERRRARKYGYDTGLEREYRDLEAHDRAMAARDAKEKEKTTPPSTSQQNLEEGKMANMALSSILGLSGIAGGLAASKHSAQAQQTPPEYHQQIQNIDPWQKVNNEAWAIVKQKIQNGKLNGSNYNSIISSAVRTATKNNANIIDDNADFSSHMYAAEASLRSRISGLIAQKHGGNWEGSGTQFDREVSNLSRSASSSAKPANSTTSDHTVHQSRELPEIWEDELDEGKLSKLLGAAGLAGAMALGGGGAQAQDYSPAYDQQPASIQQVDAKQEINSAALSNLKEKIASNQVKDHSSLMQAIEDSAVEAAKDIFGSDQSYSFAQPAQKYLEMQVMKIIAQQQGQKYPSGNMKEYIHHLQNWARNTHESLNPQQKRVGQLGPLEKAKTISPVLGEPEKSHPFQGKLVGASESIDPELKRIKTLLNHNKE